MAVEVESKLYVGHLTNPSDYLIAHGAVVVKPRTYEHNVRYESPNNEFAPNKIVLRLRQDEQARLTYKSPLATQRTGVLERLELETTVGDHDTMNAILEALGFRPYMIYEKYRTTYHFPDLPATEVVLDEMPYGVFIEVEGEAIDMVLTRLALDTLPRISQSYADLFDQLREHYQLSFTDLTFANFVGLTIDARLFAQMQ